MDWTTKQRNKKWMELEHEHVLRITLNDLDDLDDDGEDHPRGWCWHVVVRASGDPHPSRELQLNGYTTSRELAEHYSLATAGAFVLALRAAGIQVELPSDVDDALAVQLRRCVVGADVARIAR